MAMQTLRRLTVDKTATWLNGLDHTLSPLITFGRCNVRGGVGGNTVLRCRADSAIDSPTYSTSARTF